MARGQAFCQKEGLRRKLKSQESKNLPKSKVRQVMYRSEGPLVFPYASGISHVYSDVRLPLTTNPD